MSTSTMQQWVPPDQPDSPPSYAAGPSPSRRRRAAGPAPRPRRGPARRAAAHGRSVPRTETPPRRSPGGDVGLTGPPRPGRAPSPAAPGSRAARPRWPWGRPTAAGADDRHRRDVGVAEADDDVGHRNPNSSAATWRRVVSWPWPWGCWRDDDHDSPSWIDADGPPPRPSGPPRARRAPWAPGWAPGRRPGRRRGSDPCSRAAGLPGPEAVPVDQVGGLLDALLGRDRGEGWPVSMASGGSSRTT